MVTPRTNAQRRPVTDLFASLLVVGGLYVFITSFFLAKRSLPVVSDCNEAATLLRDTLGLTEEETDNLQNQGILSSADSSEGCWMQRRVDSMVVIVVDALRFDFALHHLPLSVGARLAHSNSSRLLRFVADPPTVTMQRLKALATGGLPTFADVSNNFGGATVDEDTWVMQLKSTPYRRRHLKFPPRLAFAGDDTWIDLFAGFCDECFPYPSFNTRDLDTVDNGCLYHVPLFLDHLRTTGASEKELEVMILHFLGVDHVGHTYGPHNIHMDQKLNQMDVAMKQILEFIDNSSNCHMAFIFGDHGMTEDGNHGGGTEEEINAALFVHRSPACGSMTAFDGNPSVASDYAQTAFESIHQIDLVPTIALLLGLPIPFANLGSLVPSLLLVDNPAQTAAALALNAAQVWRYYTVYSSTANALPNLPELEERLKEAVVAFKYALAYPESTDSNSFHKACNLLKIFLMEALELGQKVWTRFDDVGMATGAATVVLGTILWTRPFFFSFSSSRLLPLSQFWEVGLTMLFMVMQCGVLTFGNSYILEEEHILMYMIGVLGFVLYIRLDYGTTMSNISQQQSWLLKLPLVIPCASRLSELYVTGHGMDPSVGVHPAHHPAVFLGSLSILTVARWYMLHKRVAPSYPHMVADCCALLFLGHSWWEKRIADLSRTGFFGSRVAIALFVVGFLVSLYELAKARETGGQPSQMKMLEKSAITSIAKFLIAIMTVTGPSAATSAVFYTAQALVVYWISKITAPRMVPSVVLAFLWRLITRHVFFATNHGCSFSRTQPSAAFVATTEFNFVFAGSSLFINTFGWEMVGLVIAWLLSCTGRPSIWRCYCLFQMIETFCSCVSVSVLKRHLMVWDIYAPHFMFVSIFATLNVAAQLLVYFLNTSRSPPP